MALYGLFNYLKSINSASDNNSSHEVVNNPQIESEVDREVSEDAECKWTVIDATSVDVEVPINKTLKESEDSDSSSDTTILLMNDRDDDLDEFWIIDDEVILTNEHLLKRLSDYASEDLPKYEGSASNPNNNTIIPEQKDLNKLYAPSNYLATADELSRGLSNFENLATDNKPLPLHLQPFYGSDSSSKTPNLYFDTNHFGDSDSSSSIGVLTEDYYNLLYISEEE